MKRIMVERIKNNESRFNLNDIEFCFEAVCREKDIAAVYSGKSIDDLEFLTKFKIASFYNRKLEEKFRDDPERSLPYIYKKDFILSYLEDLSFETKAVEFFNSLVGSGIVSTCGSGYLFDNGRIEVTEEERDRAMKILFKGYKKKTLLN